MNQEEINSVLEPQEQIVWQGIVSRKVMYFSLAFSLVVVLSISLFLFSKETIDYTANGVAKTVSGSTLGMIIIGVGLLLS
ncbi:hypothetical protein HY478_02600, partial [Candidatus Uhrbacteria bacterium]|nr:hypothetical protein [Candidatus Uhrbacteria bacterium]